MRARILASSVLLCILAPPLAWAHTISDVAPYHLAPGDHFTVEVAGVAIAPGDTVVVRFTPFGGGPALDQGAESWTATKVGVRVPAAATAGQHDVEVLINGTSNTGTDGRIWVRSLPFSLIRESSGQLPGQPAGSTEASFKDSDFGDVDGDGFLDVFEAVSREGSGADNNDRLYINQLGKPGARDCAGTSFFCNQTGTNYEQTPAGVPANSRTYDADLEDLDLDGDVDLIRGDNRDSAPLRVLLNDGSGHFTDQTLAKLPALATLGGISTWLCEVDTGDADGDGRPDILACSWGDDPSASQNVLLLNRLHTTGNFVLANDDPCNPADSSAHALCKTSVRNNRGCAFAKLDANDSLDIIMPSIGNQGDVVLLFSGLDGGIPQYTIHEDWVKSSGGGAPATAKNGDLKVADLDGDGDDDVVVTAPQDGATARRRILWNDAGTRLVELDDSRYPETGNDYDVSLGDLDRDGDLDLMFGNRYNSFGPVLINKGGQGAQMWFDPTPSDFWLSRSPGGVVPAPGSVDFGLSVHPGDYDLDGDLDLLTGGFHRMGVWTSDLFQKPGQARDWVFILDKTRSMVDASRDFFEPAKNVLATFSTQRRDDDAVGFVTFEYSGTDFNNPNALDNANKAQRVVEVGDQSFFTLADTIRATPLGGCSGFCTPIGWGLKTGMEMAADAPVPNPNLPREQILVLATDGEQNQAPHPDAVIPDLPAHVRLYTIALGTGTDDRMLSALATNGGKFYFAGRSSDYPTVQSVLREVHDDIEGDATGKQPLLPLAELAWAKGLFTVLAESPVIRRSLASPQVASAVAVETPLLQTAGERYLFLVDPADREVRFTLSWRNPDRLVQLELTDPSGRKVPMSNNPKVRQRRWSRALAVTVQDPLSGLWVVERKGGGDLGARKATGMASSLLTLVGEAEHPRFYLGENLVLTAEALDGATAVPGARGEVRCISPAKQVQAASAVADAGGRLRFDCGPAIEAGSYQVQATVYGPAGRPFVRHWQSAVHVATPTPEELDLRTAELSLDRNRLTAGGTDAAVATLVIKRRDGAPLPGAKVRFLVRGGEAVGAVTDHGDGRYSQSVKAGPLVGEGEVRARVGLERLRNRAAFTIVAGGFDPGRSSIDVMVGPKILCTTLPATYAVLVTALDAGENPISGATVTIEQSGGPGISWEGPVKELAAGLYERRFSVPRQAGTLAFKAAVGGVSLGRQPTIQVFAADTEEGRLLGCGTPAEPSTGGSGEPSRGCLFWLLVLLVVLIVLLLLWWLLRKRGP
ncbi:MAG TPA: FG-GAP-like repeat-containing protein [Thermoanaerobaculia bacterium]|nr:FG-GAP-like repeat-containing protein [Thermoanaerobaculia bacterium]